MSDFSRRFQAGGTVRDGAFYVERTADQELISSLLDGEYCYVLAPRQIGKSSLRARVEKRLQKKGYTCASIDLTSLGSSEVSQEEWYYGLVEEVGYRLNLEEDPADFWVANEQLSPVHRWSRFINREVLSKTETPIVIFIDEIDALLSLPFPRDDFFASIRAFFNARADNIVYERLSFCLLGVATPHDLSTDPTRTPFNIGHDVHVEDFTSTEAKAFLPGLAITHIPPQELLDAVYHWTNGHPYMTQRMFEALSQGTWSVQQSASEIAEQVARKLFLGRGGQVDTNLSVAEKLFQYNELKDLMLQIYRQLLEGIKIEANLYNPVHMALRLTGMVSQRRVHGLSYLWVRNLIFAHVFDRVWVQKQEAERLLNLSLERWLLSAREDDYVLRGKALAVAQEWAEGRDDITSDERAFLIASLGVARKEEEAKQMAERDRERRQQAEERARFQQRAIRVLTVLVIALLGLVAFAFWQYQQAEEAKGLELLAKNKAILAQEGERKQKAKAERALVQVKKVVVQVSQEQRKTTRALKRVKKAERKATNQKRRALRLFHQVRSSLRKERRARRAALQAHRRSERLQKRESSARMRAEQAEKAAQEGSRAISLAAQPGREMAAIRSGILGVVPSLRSGRTPPLQALEGLVVAVNAARHTRGFRGHSQAVTRTRFLHKNRAFLSASADHTLRLWDVEDGRMFGLFQGHHSPVRALAIAPRNNQVASADDKGLIFIWNIKSCLTASERGKKGLCRPTPLRKLKGHQQRVNVLAYSRDGRWLASAGDDGTARIWEASTGRLVRIIRGHRKSIRALAFSHNANLLATAGVEREILLWRWKNGVVLRRLRGHQKTVNALMFSSNKQTLVSASDDHTARLWNVRSGKSIRTWRHTKEVTSVAFSPKGSMVVTTSGDLARVWSMQTGRRLRVLNAHTKTIRDATFSRRGTHLLTASEDQTVRLWRLSRKHSTLVFRGHKGMVSSAQFNLSGKGIITTSSDATIRLWNLQGQTRKQLLGHKSWVKSASLSSKNSLVTASLDRTIRLWDLRTGRLRRAIPGLSWQESVAFAPNAKSIAGAGQARLIRLIDVQSGKTLRLFRGHRGTVTSLAFSPNGRWLLSGSEDRTLRIWNVQKGTLLNILEGHERAVTSVSFSPDGTLLLSASRDGTARLWRRRDGKRLSTLRGHRKGVLSATFSPDGKRIATASQDKTVRLWDVQTARSIAVLLGHTRSVLSVRFSPRGDYLITGGADHTARMFPASEKLYLRMACRLLRYQREFPSVRTHCNKYLHSRSHD